MSEKVHRRLSKAQEAYEAKDYATAHEVLNEIFEFRNLSPYERAQTHNFAGSVYVEMDDLSNAILAFEQVIRIGGPDEIGGLYNRSIKVLAQLHMISEDYAEAVRYGRQWLDAVANPAPNDYMLLAQAHYQLDEWREVLEYVSLAIERARVTNVEVQENWWNFIIAAHWELEQFAEALDVTKILLVGWPKKKYWLSLSGLYAIEEDDAKQFAAYWSAYDQGLLTRSSELVNMAQFFMLAEVPYKAAVLLQDGLDSGAIEANAKNYRLLAQAWQLAREDEQVLAPLRKAAESEEDTEDKSTLYVRLAETYYALSDYEQCVLAVRQSIREGDLNSEGRTYMLLGQCLFEQENYEEAKDAFKKAARDEDTRPGATRWQIYLDNEVTRRRNLEARLAQYDN